MIEEYTPPFKGLKSPEYRVRLGQYPTPIRPFYPPGFPEDMQLWIKRDDYCGSDITGNKARKLEFLLADALAHEADTIITCGGIQSNHCRAAAIAARQLGMTPHLLLRTEDTKSDPGLVGNLLLDRMVGAELQLITPEQYARRDQLMSQAAEQLRQKGKQPYIIPEGGSNGIGTWGYLEAAREIKGQTLLFGFNFDRIVFACGSGGTAAGLALGMEFTELRTKLHPVNVCDSADYFYKAIQRIFEELGSKANPRNLLQILDGHVGKGYAKNTLPELALIRNTARQTGVILDPVYSGKALYGFREEVLKNPDEYKDQNILFLHTGGIFGLYDKTEQIQELLG